MNPSWVFLSVLVFWMVFLGIIQAGSIDETRPHIKDLHRQSHHSHGSVKHHQKHHKGLKTRASNSSTCISVFELELISITRWLNNTNELKVIFSLIPPSVKQLILQQTGSGGSNSSNPESPDNSTLNNPNLPALNGSAALDLNSFYEVSVDWPILTYFARLAGYFLSRAHGLPELFSNLPMLRDVWRVFLRGLLRGAERTDVLLGNLRDLFGFTNGTISSNLFNVTHWEQVLSPSGIAHVVEGGIETLANIPSILG
ncbi:uncharacterized protein LOC109535395 [Dendroctonus ponderosae]|uniref:uncharacterized protein LOC109535395 n=1 Tax=Dendroctonus ponderosae TaxID=77166 RepID=UPI002036519D|nr:uncharacterized protein LOC109535395 [Dendroctonus ponderosae]